MAGQYGKNTRILALYERLCAGKTIYKSEEARRFGIDERSVQRDIDDIRTYLAEQNLSTGEQRELVYDRRQKGFRLTGFPSPLMSNSEVLAVSKILLESRAFPKEELSAILKKLISGCVPLDKIKLISDLLSNEMFHYVELTHPVSVQDKLWKIGSQIQQRRLLQIRYQRQGEDASHAVTRTLEPVAILFSEYYFYLNAYLVEPGKDGYLRRYDYPAVFRLDRIVEYHLLEETFFVPYASRFQEGEFRKRVQFMYPGQLQSIRFRYTGTSVEAVLDRLPTASVISQGEEGVLIEAEVYGNGIVMWLLSQGERVEVLSPPSLREEMKRVLRSALKKYQDENPDT